MDDVDRVIGLDIDNRGPRGIFDDGRCKKQGTRQVAHGATIATGVEGGGVYLYTDRNRQSLLNTRADYDSKGMKLADESQMAFLWNELSAYLKKWGIH